MSAAVLREAAALMRERAEAASCLQDGSPDRWFVENLAGGKATVCVTFGNLTGDIVDPTEAATAEHIAGMDPTVTLLVADWLSTAYTLLYPLGPGAPRVDACCRSDAAFPTEEWCAFHVDALAVATAYLGGTR